MSLCAVVAGLGVASSLAMNMGWGQDDSAAIPALWGSVAVAMGVVSGLVLLRLLLSLDRVPVAMAVVGAGVARMLASLACGLALYFVTNPEGKTYWTAFLVGNLLALAVETMWGIKSNNRDAATASVTGSV